MALLKSALEADGFQEVSTYINSGNIVFTHETTDERELAERIERVIEKQFGFFVSTVVISEEHLAQIIANMPKGWGGDAEWKYNLIFLILPYDIQEVVSGIGELKPDIEAIVVGEGVLYQSMSRQLFGRTTTGKLASRPVYQKMTIRTIGTAQKLLSLLGTK
jgi:uncharacterized protein (DUF1697 family)